MALEHSVLNEQKIKELIKEYWNISVVQVEKMPLGSANCYRVTGESDCYFLKEFQSDFQSEDLIREAELTTFLARHGIPTAQFIPTTDGKMHIVHQGHCICLQEYIDGTQFGYIQYLTSDSEDREGLIKFAFWRTAVCREVKEKATDMVAALFARMSKEI